MLIRLGLIVVFVGIVGVFMGTIQPQKILSQIPRLPRAHPQDPEAEYLRLVESKFRRLQPLSDEFFDTCSPDPHTARSCSALATQMLRDLRVFQADLRRASVPASFARADATLKRSIARGIQGFTLVQRAVRTHRRSDWIRARDALAESFTLLDRTIQALAAIAEP
jgi:hypothetical protein